MREMVDPKALPLELGGRWFGSSGSAPCCVCQPERRKDQNALSITVKGEKLLLHCKKSGCAFEDILTACGIRRGHFEIDEEARRQAEREQRKEIEKRSRQAREIWLDTVEIAGTVAETYLRSRGITCELPASLRFHPGCWHSPSCKRYPAMVARVDGSAGFAVHRTYLTPHGAKADIQPNKMMLGLTKGGAVRLRGDTGPLVVAEGIETALSIACGIIRGPFSVWAALSTSGMVSLKLPSTPRVITIAPDTEEAGQSAAYQLAEKAHSLGWDVSILNPPYGSDWNDVLIHEQKKVRA